MGAKHYLGKYRLLAELGHGGMADVFLALVEGPTGLGFAKLAVVKRLRANLAEDPEFVTMLIDEARITARLNHPNVVQMLEVGEVDEEYFLAMEYLDGQPLHRLERRISRAGESLSRAVQLTILSDVLSGLHHAHELVDFDGTPLEVIHRDVTPHNIFITYDGQVKVMDFGIAKAAGRAQETKHGIVKGKTRFMSPEQAIGGAVDRRADLFAVGILVWQAATGRRFWGDLDELAIIEQLIGGRYDASPKSVAKEVPDALDAICRRALARNANDRYATALEMQHDIDAFLAGEALVGRRELATLANEHFAKERAQLRAIVESAGKEARANSGPLSLFAQRAASSSTSTSIPGMVASVAPQNAQNTSGVSDVRVVTVSSVPPGVIASTNTPANTSNRRSLVMSALGAASLALVGVSLVSLVKDDRPANRNTTAVVVADFVRLQDDGIRQRRSHIGRDREGERDDELARLPAVDSIPTAATPHIHAASIPRRAVEPPPAAAPPSTPPVPSAVTATSVVPPSQAPTPRGARRLNVDVADPWLAPSAGKP